jgi:hypothetical protein
MNDPIVDEVRKVREAHASRFNYDLDAIFRAIKEQEKRSGRAFVSFPSRKVEPSQALHPTGAAISAAHGASSLQDAPTTQPERLAVERRWFDACHSDPRSDLLSLSRRRSPASQPRTPPRKSSIAVLSPRLFRKFKFRRWLRKQLATGFELLRGNGGFLWRHESRN